MKDQDMETPDGINMEPGSFADEIMKRQLPKTVMALTADQQIVLKCMEIVGEGVPPTITVPKMQKHYRDTVDALIHRVTTGNWPDDANEKP